MLELEPIRSLNFYKKVNKAYDLDEHFCSVCLDEGQMWENIDTLYSGSFKVISGSEIF